MCCHLKIINVLICPPFGHSSKQHIGPCVNWKTVPEGIFGDISAGAVEKVFVRIFGGIYEEIPEGFFILFS